MVIRKIALLIPSLKYGGAERVAILLAKGFANKGYEIHIVNFEEGLDYYLDKTIKRFVLTKLAGNSSKWLKLFISPLQIYKLQRLLKKENYDLIISFMERASFYVFILKKTNSIYFFHSHPTSNIYKEKNNTIILGIFRQVIYKYFLGNSYRYCRFLVTISEAAKYDLIHNFGIPETKIEVIYNPYPIEEIRERAKEDVEDVFEENLYLINVGRLTKAKGQWWLLRLFKELKKDFPNLKLLILGDGELKNYLVNLSKQLSLKTYVWDKDRLHNDYDVFFLGFKKNPFKYISRAKLFVFTSLWEGFPNALVEAMACGVPVISADCRSGPREILAPDTDFLKETYEPEFAKYGILMPVFEDDFINAKAPLTRTEKMWVDTIRKLLTNEKLLSTYSQLGVKRAYDFHINKIINKWIEVIF